jgi:hypothetical protein
VVIKSDGWEKMLEDKMQGVLIEQKISPTCGAITKASGVLDFPINSIFLTLGNSKYRKDYDPFYEKGHYFRMIGN